MTQQTQWRIGGRGSEEAETAQLPGARVHRSCGHKSQVHKRQGPKAGAERSDVGESVHGCR